MSALTETKWKPFCPNCNLSLPMIPVEWLCPTCNSEVWQPFMPGCVCFSCTIMLTPEVRTHCKRCGRHTCHECTFVNAVLRGWEARQKICAVCAAEYGYFRQGQKKDEDMEGPITVLLDPRTARSKRFWASIEGNKLLFFDINNRSHCGDADLSESILAELAVPNTLVVIGPHLNRAVQLTADNEEERQKWITRFSFASSVSVLVHQPDASEASANASKVESITKPPAVSAQLSDYRPMREYQLLTLLGTGHFANVLKVKHNATGQIYAMKILSKTQIVNSRLVGHILDELHILANTTHPFICKLHRAFQTKDHLVLLLDFLSGGELLFHLQNDKAFSERRTRFYAAEIGLALEYLHGRNILYRDLKPENLVLSRDGHVTLTDFGLAKRDFEGLARTFCGTPEYMAPEQIMEKGHGIAIDWWALGIFMYEMVNGLPPFYSENVKVMCNKILQQPLTFTRRFSPSLRSLLIRMLDRDPSRRLCSGEEFRSHPFFDGLDFDALSAKELPPPFLPKLEEDDLRYFDRKFTESEPSVDGMDLPLRLNSPTTETFRDFEF